MPDPSPDLSVAIVACNNERTIERTVRSVRDLACRLVVVDSGSAHQTSQLCRNLGADVIERPWHGYVKQKQFALEQCDTTWVLSLDSDESLDTESADAVRRAVNEDDPQVAGYEINRRTWLGEVEMRHT